MNRKVFIIMLTLLCSISTQAMTLSGSCGNNVNWTLDTSTGKLRISGTGDMDDYTWLMTGTKDPRAHWIRFAESVKHVSISNGITSIGDYTFYNCKNMTSISIPNSVKRIGNSAFSFCESLTSISLPKQLEYIDDNAFYASGLISISIPNGVIFIGERAFCDCHSLKSISIPNSVTTISSEAFRNCGLTSIVIPNRVKIIKYRTFLRCSNLNSVTIPNSVIEIGEDAFMFCSNLTSLVVPSSVIYLQPRAFDECYELSIKLPYRFRGAGTLRYCKEVNFYDPEEEEKLWAEAQKDNNEESYKKYIATSITGEHNEEARSALETYLWAEAQKENTEESYKNYLATSVKAAHKEEAQNALKVIYVENEAWQKATECSCTKEYQAYLSLYPKGRYAKNAKDWLANNDEDWCYDNLVIAQGDVKSLEIYLNNYPTGKYRNQVEETMESLVWKRSLMDNSVESYNNYLEKYPMGKYKGDAEEKMENLVWEKAAKKNSVESYNNYLDKYPTGKFATDGINRRDVLLDERQWKLTKKEASLTAYKNYIQTYNIHIKEAESAISEMENNEVSYYYVLSVGPKNQKVFYDMFLRYPCGNKALSWKYNFGKLKSIAKKEGMLNSVNDKDKNRFLCNTEYNKIRVYYYSKLHRIEVSGSYKNIFGVSNISDLIKRLANIGVSWENKNVPDAYGRYKGTYQYEGITIHIELSGSDVKVYIIK